MLDYQKAKIQMISFVEKQMELIAPNLNNLLGPEIGSKMIASAGGLVELSRIPACNIQVLGQ